MNVIVTNCKYLYRKQNLCEHPDNFRKGFTKLLFGKCKSCVFCYDRLPGEKEVTCDLKEENPRPAPPQSFSSAKKASSD